MLNPLNARASELPYRPWRLQSLATTARYRASASDHAVLVRRSQPNCRRRDTDLWSWWQKHPLVRTCAALSGRLEPESGAI